MTHDDIRTFGKVYGILNSVLRFSPAEVETCCFEPAERLKASIAKRERKLTPEHHERIAALMSDVSPDASGRINEADTGIFWIAFHQIQAAGRPALFDERMVSKNLRVPADLWDKASEKSGQEGTTVSEIIRRKLTEYVASAD